MAKRRLAGDYPLRRARGHADGFAEAAAVLRGTVEDSSSVTGLERPISPRLAGLAPWLRLGPLLEPPSPWGREDGAAR
jgi:hypothetical protein